MKTFIALLRGINVGGRNKLPMKDLVAGLEAIGLRDIRTYIQSGNVVFRSEDDEDPELLEDRISLMIADRHGFRPGVMVLTLAGLDRAIDGNPYPEGVAEPKSLHLFFLGGTPENPDLEKLSALQADSERFTLKDGVFYLHAPDGIGRSKLAAGVEKSLGVPVTARNWRTVQNIRDLAG